MQVGMSVFQKWRKARMKQMRRLARSSEVVQSLAGSTWVKYTWFFVCGGVLGFIPMSHILVAFKSPFKCALAEFVIPMS